jgi:carboxypeptidase family protein
MSRISFGALWVTGIVLSFAAIGLYGQILVGRISGAITDPTGAPVAGAKVAITNTDTQAVRTVSTDNKGFYSIAELPIGRYRVEVNQAGFKKSSQSGLTLSATRV